MPADDSIHEIGRVVRLTGELAVVEIPKAAACDGCAASGVCHSLGGSDLRELRAVNSIEAHVGDQVEVVVQASTAMKAALWVYLVPTLLMLATALGTHQLAARHWAGQTAQIITALSTLVSLGLFLFIAWIWRRGRSQNLKHFPVVTRRLAP